MDPTPSQSATTLLQAGGATSSSSVSFVSESHRIITAMDDTERGISHEWKNVQPVVMNSTRQLHHAMQQLVGRVDSLESKLDQLLVAVSTLTHDRHVKEERYASDNRAFSRAWSNLQENVDALRSDFERTAGAHHEAVRVLRDITIPELERELDAVKEVHRVQSRKEHRIEQLEKDEELLRRTKVDFDEFQKEVREIRSTMQQMQLFPAFRTPVANGGGAHVVSSGSSTASGNGGVGGAWSSWSDGVVSLSRWLWHGGSIGDVATCRKAIPWHERIVRVGEAMRWSASHPHVIKVDREGIYRIALGIFNHSAHGNATPTMADGTLSPISSAAPQLAIYVNNDPVIQALSHSSSFLLRHRQGRESTASTAVCKRCRVGSARCCCDPEAITGVTVNDLIYLPCGSVVTVAFAGDPRNVAEALLELQCLA